MCIFEIALRFAGSAIGPHSDYDHVCVIDFAGDIKDLHSIVQVFSKLVNVWLCFLYSCFGSMLG
jgi:hypothetical protein